MSGNVKIMKQNYFKIKRKKGKIRKNPENLFHGWERNFVILVGSFLWKNLGYDILLWMAGLVMIPHSVYEAAMMDGAGKIRCFFSVTLPNLVPSFFVIVVLSLMNAFKIFREAYLVAGDYPHESIYLMQHLYNNWFRELSIDKMSAAAVFHAIVIGVFVIILRKLCTKDGEVL